MTSDETVSFSFATSNEALSDTRLAAIVAEVDSGRYEFTYDGGRAVRELLAEVERLRGALAEFGKVRLEWSIQHPLFGTEAMDGPINASAACLQRNASSVRERWTVATRLVGEWREAD